MIPGNEGLVFTHSQQVSWVRAFTGGIQELQAYVKKYHTTGLVWNKEVRLLSLSLSLCLPLFPLCI